MSSSSPRSFEFQLYEYLLILAPDEPVQQELQAFKRYFLKSHPYPNAIVTKGHITLMRFIQYDSYEKPIVSGLRQLATSTIPFDVKLQDFGSFGHTIFVDIKSAAPILELVSKHKNALRPLFNKNNAFAPHFVTKPHITIARNLTPTQNNYVWPIWNRTRYRSMFQAKDMVLLRRKTGNHGYTVLYKFHFLGLPPAFKQGELFT